VARSAGPLIPRRRFGGEIKRLREARRETLARTAGAPMISVSKLSRIENGQGELNPRDVRDILRHFEIGEDTPEGVQLRGWAEQARVPGWWQGQFNMPKRLDIFIAYENAAMRIESYIPTVVPGLLQTPDYARETLRRLAPRLTPAQLDEQTDLRMERQRALNARVDPPTLLLVVPETVLHRVVGSTDVMRDQLDALMASYDNPRLDLHVIPFTAGLYAAMEGSFTLFRFADPRDPDVVAVDTVRTTLFLDQEEKVQEHHDDLLDLHHYWLDREGSREFLRRFASGRRNRG
jgi:transcriptional regulator with XRE-family HTH domain